MRADRGSDMVALAPHLFFSKSRALILFGHSGCRSFFAFVMIACMGCSDTAKLPDTVAVSGNVAYKGKPVPAAEVIFVAKEPKMPNAGGVTNENGDFSLKTSLTPTVDVTGALEGQYKVIIVRDNRQDTEEMALASKIRPGETSLRRGDPGKMKQMMANSKSSSSVQSEHTQPPQKYKTLATTDLTATVAVGMEPLKFELKD